MVEERRKGGTEGRLAASTPVLGGRIASVGEAMGFLKAWGKEAPGQACYLGTVGANARAGSACRRAQVLQFSLAGRSPGLGGAAGRGPAQHRAVVGDFFA